MGSSRVGSGHLPGAGSSGSSRSSSSGGRAGAGGAGGTSVGGTGGETVGLKWDVELVSDLSLLSGRLQQAASRLGRQSEHFMPAFTQTHCLHLLDLLHLQQTILQLFSEVLTKKTKPLNH